MSGLSQDGQHLPALPAWTSAAMLARPPADDLGPETTDGINYSALAAIHSRARRRDIRPTSE